VHLVGIRIEVSIDVENSQKKIHASHLAERIAGHQQVRALMLEGQYNGAIVHARKLLSDFGPYVGLMIDLASSAYLDQQFSLFKVVTEESVQIFNQVHERLSDSSVMKSCLALGKLLEEVGLVVEAMELYDRAIIERPYLKSMNFDFYQKVQIQRLRLSTFCETYDLCAQLYSECFSFKSENSSLRFQLLHGLVLADFYLKGSESAIHRIRENELSEWSSVDKNMLYFDLLEELLRNQISIDSLKEPFNISISGLNSFEKNLFLIAKSQKLNVDIKILNRWRQDMSPLCFMRLLVVALTRNSSPDLQRELNFCIQSLSIPSRRLLQRKWKSFLQAKTVSLDFHYVGHSLRSDRKTLQVRRGSTGDSILEAFIEKKNWSLSELFERVYGLPDVGHYETERLRLAVLRLNQKIQTVFQISEFLNYSSESVKLSQQIGLSRGDSA
jgi:hypothetical protein